MNSTFFNKIKKILSFAVALILASAVILCLLFYFSRVHYSQDSMRVINITDTDNNIYDSLLLGMCPPINLDTYVMDELMGYDSYFVGHRFKNLFDIHDYLEAALDVNTGIGLVYIVVDPERIARDYGYHASLYGRLIDKKIGFICEAYPETDFVFLLSPISAGQLSSSKPSRREKILSAYRDFYNVVSAYENAHTCYFGDAEWIISNPLAFDAYGYPTKEFYTHMMALGFYNDNYLLTHENSDIRFSDSELILNEYSGYEEYRNLDNIELVFFGDSVIGNYNDSTSIPVVTGSILNVPAYNIGLGGSSAGSGFFEEIVNNFISGDYSAYRPDEQPYYGIEDFSENSQSSTEKIFVLTFGLNDFFSGVPVNDYKNGLTDGIERLLNAYPDSRIIIMSTTFTQAFDYGQTPQNSGGELNDYIDAARSICAAFPDGTVFWTDYGVDINMDNFSKYLDDGVHPNENSRFYISRHLAKLLSSL